MFSVWPGNEHGAPSLSPPANQKKKKTQKRGCSETNSSMHSRNKQAGNGQAFLRVKFDFARNKLVIKISMVEDGTSVLLWFSKGFFATYKNCPRVISGR